MHSYSGNTVWEELLVQRWLTAQNFWKVWKLSYPWFLETEHLRGSCWSFTRVDGAVPSQQECWDKERRQGRKCVTELHEKHTAWQLYLLEEVFCSWRSSDSLGGRERVGLLCWAFLPLGCHWFKSFWGAWTPASGLCCQVGWRWGHPGLSLERLESRCEWRSMGEVIWLSEAGGGSGC